jgi:hypothetical protein
MGGIDLAVDGDRLYFLGGPHSREARLFVQDAATGGMRRLDNMVLWGTGGPWNWPVEQYEQPQRVDARDGELIVAAPSGLIVWLNPHTGAEVGRVKVPGGLTDVALLGNGRALIIAGTDVVEVARGATERIPRIAGLIAPRRLVVDPVSGQIVVAEAGRSQQMRRFSPDYQLQRTFGREGGRRTGRYRPEDFLEISGIAGDGAGGVIITENAAPRRTAHLNADGHLVNEWYGGQDFYTYVAPEADNPTRLWMHSAGWLTQVEANYTAGTWRPLATYRLDAALDRRLITAGIRNAGFQVKRLDLNGDGTRETYLWPKWSTPLLLKVDEAAGLLRPVAAMDAVPGSFTTPLARSLRAPIAAPIAATAWRFEAEVHWQIHSGGQHGWLELVDADDKPLVSCYIFRDGPKAGVTSDVGHANYLVFNDREVLNQQSAAWALTGRSQPVTIEVTAERAVLTYGNTKAGDGHFVTLERPLLGGKSRPPAAVRLRESNGGRVTVTQARLISTQEGQPQEVAIPLPEAQWTSAPLEPAVLADILRRRGENPDDLAVRRRYQGFTWADANDDGTMQGDEIRLSTSDGGHKSVLQIDDAFNIYLRADAAGGPDYLVHPPTGRTAAGYPQWDCAQFKRGPNTPYNQTRSLWVDAAGHVYQTSAYAGDGYNHNWWWPTTFVNATAVVKSAPDGTQLWQAGERAGRGSPHPAGQLLYPINTLGVVQGCVGFADYVANPAEFWTEDGLYVGGLFDRRADDGRHPRVYAWWRHDRSSDGDYRTNYALLQYDMLVGGNLVQGPTGEVLFFGAGWNNMPVYRVTGWEQIRRQHGRVSAPGDARPPGGSARAQHG